VNHPYLTATGNYARSGFHSVPFHSQTTTQISSASSSSVVPSPNSSRAGAATDNGQKTATAVVAPCQSRLGRPPRRRAPPRDLIHCLCNARGAVRAPPPVPGPEDAGDDAAGVAGDDADGSAAASADGRRRVAGGDAVHGRPGQPRAPDSEVTGQPVAQLAAAHVPCRYRSDSTELSSALTAFRPVG
jgi:hypothetical protein